MFRRHLSYLPNSFMQLQTIAGVHAGDGRNKPAWLLEEAESEPGLKIVSSAGSSEVLLNHLEIELVAVKC